MRTTLSFVGSVIILLGIAGCGTRQSLSADGPSAAPITPEPAVFVPVNFAETAPLRGNQYRSLEKDITGENRKEIITLTIERSGGGVTSTLHINDSSVTVPGYNPAGYFGVVNFDTRDKIKEIAVGDPGPSSDYTTSFYYYDGTRLLSMGTIQGLYEDMHFDGKGKVTTKTRGKILDTWFYDDDYVVASDHRLVPVPKNFYARNTVVTLLTSLPLQLSPENTRVVITLQKDEKVIIIGCDDKTWCEIKRANGMTGWFAVEDYDIIRGTNGLRGPGVFVGLSYAD